MDFHCKSKNIKIFYFTFVESAFNFISTVVHLHNGILLGHKKETFCGSMDGPGEYYAK